MNALQYEKSPYLLQHAANPVDWRPWGEEAFAAAAREDKPIFLSIGYSTCHWCHVMAHESFEDETVAEAINRAFIPIKVDREERPDIDAVYMEACVAMTGSGGWPLTVLLTPEQKPFWAGTYLPREQLLSLLEGVRELWSTERETVLAAGEELTENLRHESDPAPGAPRRELAGEAVGQLRRSFDELWGGFSRAPKFPEAHKLLFLLRYARLEDNKMAREMAEATLEHMYRGGMFDHIGGGFCRYSTDRQWMTPHFEKMLYDNALLALAYTEAWQHTGREVYRDVACRTLDYALRELRDPQGGFTCGQDADSDGEEGKYYLFTQEELTALLGGEDAAVFCARYGVTAEGNFYGKSIPHLTAAPDWEREDETVAALRRTVYDYRLTRARPHTDDKVLTAWNGLMIAALSRAGLAFAEPRYLDAAERAAEFIRAALTDDRGRLFARWRAGEAAHDGKLEDYAFLAWGLIELYGALFRPELLAWAAALADELLERFGEEGQGGFYPYASDSERLLTRRRTAHDGAMPSGNAAAALALSRLSRLTGEERFRAAAERQLRYLAGAMEEYPAGHCFGMLALMEELWPSAELLCAAPSMPGELREFLRAPRLHLTTLLKTPQNAQALAAAAPFTADYPCAGDRPRYYLCRGRACAAPVDSTAQISWN